MFPTKKEELEALRKMQAALVRAEKQVAKQRVREEQLKASAAQTKREGRIKKLERQLQQAKTNKAERESRSLEQASHQRQVRQLASLKRYVSFHLREEEPPVQPPFVPKLLPPSMQTVLRNGEVMTVHLLHGNSPAFHTTDAVSHSFRDIPTLVPALPTDSPAKQRVKAYASRVQEAFRPSHSVKKALEVDLRRTKLTGGSPPRRIKLAALSSLPSL